MERETSDRDDWDRDAWGREAGGQEHVVAKVESDDELTAGMTVEQEIGQLFAIGFSGTSAPREVIELIQREHVGAIILFSRNIRSRAQTAALTQQLQTAAREAGHPYPLLIMTDQENGLVRRLGPDSTVFPGNMALGAIGGDLAAELTYEIARATAQELKAHGINMNLAPVVDVNSNPANPVIGIRSFGERADQVARLGAAAVRGYQDEGVLAALKHFPGHGDTAVDSHRALPVVGANCDRLEALELVPFQEGIRAGAMSVLMAHVAVPALTAGETLPATIAPSIVQGLLRERLGFDGLVLSDCLEMDAIAGTVGVPRGAVLALRAGIDLVLVSHRQSRQRAALAAVRTAVASGELDASRVREAAARVLRAKRRALSWAPSATLTDDDLAAHVALRDRAYALSATVVRDERGLLPLRLEAGDELLVIQCPSGAITQAADVPYRRSNLLSALRGYHACVRAVTLAPGASDDQIAGVIQAASRAARVLVVTLNLHLDGEQQRILRRVVTAGTPAIGLAVCDPYDAGALADVPTYLATYDYSQPALHAAARVLFGGAKPTGRPPVTLALH